MRHALTILTTCLPASLSAQEAPPCGLYGYKATIQRVIDGDTVVANIDLGFDIWLHNEHLRLIGIDAPENKTEAGLTVSATLRARIEGQSLHICTTKAKRSEKESTGSFGRYLVTIFHNGENINEWLLNNGHAVAWDK